MSKIIHNKLKQPLLGLVTIVFTIATLFAVALADSKVQIAAGGFGVGNNLTGFWQKKFAVSGISLVGTASNSALNGGNVTVTLPGGVATGDVVYASYCLSGLVDFNMSTVTAGYSELADVYGNDDVDANLGVYRKVQGGSPDTTVEFTGSGVTTNSVIGTVMVLRGVNSTPEDATTTTATGTNSANADPPSITTVTANAWVLAIACGSEEQAATTAPTNYIDLIFDIEIDADEGTGAMSRQLIVSPGAENPGAYVIDAGSSRSWSAASVAVRPAP